jgi:hypothetical protein
MAVDRYYIDVSGVIRPGSEYQETRLDIEGEIPDIHRTGTLKNPIRPPQNSTTGKYCHVRADG